MVSCDSLLARLSHAPLVPAVSLVALVAALGAGGCTCSKASEAPVDDAAGVPGSVSDASETVTASAGGAEGAGLSSPIAAARGERGDVVAAGLDVRARAIRVQRISDKDEVLADRTVFDGVAWSSESELKVVPAAAGVAVTWRGLRNGKLVRQLAILGADLAPVGGVIDVAAASCATRDAVWFTDGKRVHMRPWSGAPARFDLPREKDAALVCGSHRAFVLLDDEDGTSMVIFGGAPLDKVEAGVVADGGGRASTASPVVPLLKEADFGEDDQRERPEYTVSDDVGVVRLAASGSITLREVRGGAPGPLRKLKTSIGRDDDVVAVDASSRVVVIVFTEDVSDACAKDGGGAATVSSTRVKALRIDRTTFEESVVELSPGMCAREVGPFFTGAQGDSVSVAWVEREPIAGKSKAPIAALAHRLVPAAGAAPELARIDQPADALVDAGCDGTRCYAVALARRAGMDAMVPGFAKVIRY